LNTAVKIVSQMIKGSVILISTI